MQDNTGYLRKNARRVKDRDANATGKAMIEGREYWMSAWTNTGDDGTKYQKITFRAVSSEPAQAGPGPIESGEPDEDLPF